MDLSDVVKKLKNRYPEDSDVKELEKLLKVLDDKKFDTDLLMKIDEIVKNRILEHEMSKPHNGYRYWPWYDYQEYKPLKIWYGGTSDKSSSGDGTWQTTTGTVTISNNDAPTACGYYNSDGSEQVSFTCSKKAMDQFMGTVF